MEQSPEDNLTSKLEFDESVTHQQKESWRHWAGKATIVRWLKSNPDINGIFKTEKKVEDKIPDIRCELSQRPNGMPQRFVVEVQTEHSQKDILKSTHRYHRFGYAVYWVFVVQAHQQRRDAEAELSTHMTQPVSLGRISLPDGHLHLGRPITHSNLDYNPEQLPDNEFYVPTYHRNEQHYDHGDFEVNGTQMTIYSACGCDEYYYSIIDDEGQRTLPQQGVLSNSELYQGLNNDTIRRVAAVRGPP